jgi:polysaccharide export outer membrane protein
MGRDELGSQIPVNTAGAFGRLRATIVQESGDLVLPLLGPVTVTGRSLEEIRALIENSYANRIATSNVDIIMQSCRSQPVHVTGAVNVPGTYYLCNDLRTLNDALSEAQWLSADAFPAGGVLTRRGETYQLNYPLHDDEIRDLDILLEPGDSIYFPTIDDGVLPKVHVFGEVRAQGTFPVPADGLTLLDALGLAECTITETADMKEIYLMRIEEQDTPVTYRITLAELFQGPSVPLSANDRIYVPPRGISRWDTWWRLAIPISISARAVGN